MILRERANARIRLFALARSIGLQLVYPTGVEPATAGIGIRCAILLRHGYAYAVCIYCTFFFVLCREKNANSRYATIKTELYSKKVKNATLNPYAFDLLFDLDTDVDMQRPACVLHFDGVSLIIGNLPIVI